MNLFTKNQRGTRVITVRYQIRPGLPGCLGRKAKTTSPQSHFLIKGGVNGAPLGGGDGFLLALSE